MGCLERVYHYLKDNGPTTPTELRESLGFTNRTIHGVLKRLLEAGEVGKSVDSRDRRQSLYFKRKRERKNGEDE